MYFPDLTKYSYSVPRPLPHVLHVGWLDAEHPFPRGEVEPALVEKLIHLAVTQPANRMRGVHACELCPPRTHWGNDPFYEHVEHEGRRVGLGSAELWVPDPTGERIYAAPNLIVHVIAQHGYLPPAAFLSAVAAFDPATWDGEAECEAAISLGYDVSDE